MNTPNELPETLLQHDATSQLVECLAGIDSIHSQTAAAGTLPGQLGEFRLIREVGRGGMGVVYEAEQVSLGRRVAVKVLRVGIGSASEESGERFRREAQTVANLHHTNIVPITAVGSQQDVQFYAMQFIEGQSLADVLNAGALSRTAEGCRQLADWGRQAAEALEHAHRHGVVHRDIKPSNLLPAPSPRARLVGLPDLCARLRLTESRCGNEKRGLAQRRCKPTRQARGRSTIAPSSRGKLVGVQQALRPIESIASHRRVDISQRPQSSMEILPSAGPRYRPGISRVRYWSASSPVMPGAIPSSAAAKLTSTIRAFKRSSGSHKGCSGVPLAMATAIPNRDATAQSYKPQPTIPRSVWMAQYCPPGQR